MRRIIILLTVLALAGCGLRGVRQSDLDTWVGTPVTALDTHSLFLTMRLERSYASNGAIEIRNYVNEANVTAPVGMSGLVVSRRIACNNLFYIHDDCVVEYRPTGRCYTDATTRPHPSQVATFWPVTISA